MPTRRNRLAHLAALVCLAALTVSYLWGGATPAVSKRFDRAEEMLQDIIERRSDQVEAAARRLAILNEEGSHDRIAQFRRAEAIRKDTGVDGVALVDWENRPLFWSGRSFTVDPVVALYHARHGTPSFNVHEQPGQQAIYCAYPAGSGVALAFLIIDQRFPRRDDLGEKIARACGLSHVKLTYTRGFVSPTVPDARTSRSVTINQLVHAVFYAPTAEETRREVDRARAVRGQRLIFALAVYASLLLGGALFRRLQPGGVGRALVVAVSLPGLRVLLALLGLPADPLFGGGEFQTALWGSPGGSLLSAGVLLAAAIPMAKTQTGRMHRGAWAVLGAIGVAACALAPLAYTRLVTALADRADGVVLFDPLHVLPDLPAAALLASLGLLTGALFVLARASQRILSRRHRALGALPLLAMALATLPWLGPWQGPWLALGCLLAVAGLATGGSRPERAATLAFLAAVTSFPFLYLAHGDAYLRDAARAARELIGDEADAAARWAQLDKAIDAVLDEREGADREAANRIAEGRDTHDLALLLWAASDWPPDVPCAVQVWDKDINPLSAFDFDAPQATWLPLPPGSLEESRRKVRGPGDGRGEAIDFLTRTVVLRTIGDERAVGIARFSVPDRWDMLLASARPSMFTEPPHLLAQGASPPVYLADLEPHGVPRFATGGTTSDIDVPSAKLLAEARERGHATAPTRWRGKPARLLVVSAAKYHFAAVIFAESLFEQAGFAFAKVLLVQAALCLLYMLALLVWRRGRIQLRFRHRLVLLVALLTVVPVALLSIYNQSVAEQRYERDIRDRLEDRLDLASNLLEGERRLPDTDWCLWFAEKAGMDLNIYRGAELIATSRPGVWDTGLLSRRLAAPAYLNIVLSGRGGYAGTEGFTRGAELHAAYRRIEGDWEENDLRNSPDTPPNNPSKNSPDNSPDSSLGNPPGNPLENSLVLAAPALEDRRELERRETQSAALLLASYLVASILTVLLGLLLARTLSRPLRELRDATQRVAAGQLRPALPEGRGDEFGDLMRAFNRMTRELAEAQDLRVRAEKAAAWREMARQIAHDIKNPLTPIKLTVQNLLAAYDQDPDGFEEQFRDGGRLILDQIDNLHRIAGQFSTYARMPIRKPQPVSLLALVDEIIALYSADGDLVLERRGEEDEAAVTVLGDRDELRRALGNLVTNARQAKATRTTLTLEPVGSPVGSPVESRVKLVVNDNGAGIEADVLGRIFEPSFTTKTSGTGLGLPIVKRIVDDHLGTIAIKSTPGLGTRVTILLPRHAT